MEFARARPSEEMPLGDAARAIGEALAPMATAAGTARAGRTAAGRRRRIVRPGYSGVFVRGENGEGFGTYEVCWCTMRGNRGETEIVVVRRDGRVGRRWFEDGIKADLRYYFGDEDDPSKRWT